MTNAIITHPSHPAFAAIMLKGHLRMLSVGMKHSKITGTQILAKASEITGNKYKRGQYDKAKTDIEQWLKVQQGEDQ